MSELDFPPESWPKDARAEAMTSRVSQQEIVDWLEVTLDIDSIDTNIGNPSPSKKGLAQIVLAIEREIEE